MPTMVMELQALAITQPSFFSPCFVAIALSLFSFFFPFFFLCYYPPLPKMNTMGSTSPHHSYSEVVAIPTHPPHEDNNREVRSTPTLA